jgi:hypothetical protein
VAREASWSSRVGRFHQAMLACLPSLAVVVVAGGRDPAATVASVERDPSYQAPVTVVDDAAQALASDEGSPRYLLVLPAGVVLPPGGLLAFAGALARTPGAAAVAGELAGAGDAGSLRELAWSRFGTPADTSPDAASAVGGDAPVVVRRRDLAAGGPVVTFPELLVGPAPTEQADGLDPPVRLALARRSGDG